MAMVNQNAREVARRILPGAPAGLLEEFAQWAIEYAQDNPEDVQAFSDAVYNWVMDNGREIGDQAFNIADRVTSDWVDMIHQTATSLRADFDNIFGDSSTQLRRQNDAQLPTNGNVIPENSRTGTRRINSGEMDNGRGTVRPATGPPDGQPEAQVARIAQTAGPAGNNMSKGETPISPWPSISYGLQDTHTTIIPWTGWISAVGMDEITPLKLEVKMNSIFDFVNNNALTTPPNVGAAFVAKGFYSVPITADAKRAALGFPESYSGSTTEQPAWRSYWCNLYDYYTVVGCEYKFIIHNPSEVRGNSVIVGTQFDTYTDVGGQAQNVMPSTRLSQAMSYKNIKWNVVESDALAQNKSMAVVAGNYKPGQAKRNIINDGDTKTWIWTGSAGAAPSGTPNQIPNMKENITLHMWRGGLAASNTGVYGYGVNIQMEIKYIVQFKDLREQARYPNTVSVSGNNIVSTLGTDATLSGAALQRW